jgi:hypothetical protein
MSTKTLRNIIIVLTLFTAAVHGITLNMQGVDLLFTLNALGYLALLGALLGTLFETYLSTRQRLLHYVFIAYAGVTILAWAILNGDFSDPLGVTTKTVEVLLIVFLWMHLKRTEDAPRAEELED